MKDRLPVYLENNDLPCENGNSFRNNSYGYVGIGIIYLISIVISVISIIIVIIYGK